MRKTYPLEVPIVANFVIQQENINPLYPLKQPD
jgi:hypothetical protein